MQARSGLNRVELCPAASRRSALGIAPTSPLSCGSHEQSSLYGARSRGSCRMGSMTACSGSRSCSIRQTASVPPARRHCCRQAAAARPDRTRPGGQRLRAQGAGLGASPGQLCPPLRRRGGCGAAFAGARRAAARGRGLGDPLADGQPGMRAGVAGSLTVDRLISLRAYGKL